jgi:hypothetical protein
MYLPTKHNQLNDDVKIISLIVLCIHTFSLGLLMSEQSLQIKVLYRNTKSERPYVDERNIRPYKILFLFYSRSLCYAACSTCYIHSVDVQIMVIMIMVMMMC